MNDNQWTDHFFYQKQRVKVVLADKNISIQYDLGNESVSLDFDSTFQSVQDEYGNLICLLIHGSRSITLAHDNPTVLSQWQQILNKHIHRMDFLRYFQPRNKIGEGISANVFIGIRKSDKRKVSVKVFCKNKLKQEKDLLALKNEISILKSIKGNFFPQFISTFSTENSYYLVYDWCEGISLKQWVSKGFSNQKQIKQIAIEICQTLKLLNNYGIVHRDLKPENIIYDQNNRKIKIIDFGFATHFTSESHIYPSCGTPGYVAPEVLDKSKILITPQIDIFSLGITIYYLVYGKLPYSSKCNVLKANKDCIFSFDNNLFQRPILCDLLKRMICPLKYRLSLNEVINHNYFKQQGFSHNRQSIKNQLFNKLLRNDVNQLDVINRKIQIKREQRLQRQRLISVRNQSHIKICSRDKSYRNRSRFVTEIF